MPETKAYGNCSFLGKEAREVSFRLQLAIIFDTPGQTYATNLLNQGVDMPK
jgi:hypothetical protein